MKVTGTFGKFIKRNEKTGVSRFTFHENGVGCTYCTGVCVPYTREIPVIMDCEDDGHGGYMVNNIKAFGYSYPAISLYLCSGEFTGIGGTAADRILKAADTYDLFGFVRNLSDGETFTVKYVPAQVTESMIKRIRYITVYEDIVSYVTKQGGDYHTAARIYKKMGAGVAEAVKTNPYLLLYAGADFGLCDKIAAESGIAGYDRRRVRAITEYAVESERNNGNTKIPVKRLFKKVEFIEKRSGQLLHTHPLFIGEEILTGNYVYEESNGEAFVYAKQDYINETDIAANMKRLYSSQVALNDITPVEQIEKECNVTYSGIQRETFSVLKTSGVKIITGGPGTGKTTLLNGLLKKYSADNPGKEVILCAPTGCASRRMAESTGRGAATVHKTLGLRPFEKDEAEPVTKKLTTDCIVVDECSMLDTEIFAKLLSSIKNGALLILLGDKDQLPSIGAGNVLSDLLETGVESFHLNHIFRQNADNPIISNSRKVSDGQSNLKTGEKFMIKRFSTEDDLVNFAVKAGAKCRGKSPNEVKFYTPSRNAKFLSGTIRMNRKLQDARGKNGTGIIYGDYTFYKGDCVLFNTNNYEKGYYNGEEGVITDIQEHSGTQYVTVSTADGRVYLSGTDLDDLELGYILTAHKSQGGECDNAVILIPQNPASLLKRQLLYVEITRARKSVTILTEGDALEKAISSRYENIRTTGLKEKIQA